MKTHFKEGAFYEPVEQSWGCCRSTLQAFIRWIHREDYMKVVHHLETKKCQSQNMIALMLDIQQIYTISNEKKKRQTVCYFAATLDSLKKIRRKI